MTSNDQLSLCILPSYSLILAGGGSYCLAACHCRLPGKVAESDDKGEGKAARRSQVYKI